MDGTWLSREEAIVAVDRVLSGTYEAEEAAAWLALVEHSLGLEQGKLVALVFYPDESGASDDADGEALIALAGRDV